MPVAVRGRRAAGRVAPECDRGRSTPYDPAATGQSADSAVPPPRTPRPPQPNRRAVLPQTLERVVGALLAVLDVNDDVNEVEQDPATVPFTFPAYGGSSLTTGPLFDRVDDGLHLSLARRGGKHETVGDHQSLAD